MMLLPVIHEASIVVPVFNAAATVGECVRSLLALDYPAEQMEILCVDNGSTDGSLRILEGFGGRIRVLREARRGPGAARNHGLRAARFPVVAFTDSDCKADPQWLREIIAPLADPSVGAVGGAIRAWGPANRVALFGETIHDMRKAIEVCRPPYVATGNWASRRPALRELGGFDESFFRGEDTELSCRMLQAGLRLVHAPGAVVYHRNESTVRGLFVEGFQHGMSSIPLIERHRGFYDSFGYRGASLRAYGQLWRRWREGAPRESLLFNAGKRAGRLAGSIRYGALHL